jgi:hypothetical protein
VGAHPSPPAFASLRRGRQSSPLQQGERRDKPDGIQTFPQGQSRPGLASQKLKHNYENKKQN